MYMLIEVDLRYRLQTRHYGYITYVKGCINPYNGYAVLRLPTETSRYDYKLLTPEGLDMFLNGISPEFEQVYGAVLVFDTEDEMQKEWERWLDSYATVT